MAQIIEIREIKPNQTDGEWKLLRDKAGGMKAQRLEKHKTGDLKRVTTGTTMLNLIKETILSMKA